jgi:predicted MFS family arabinose efflux permease
MDTDEPTGPRSTWGLVAGASLISTGLAAYEIAPASVTPLLRESLGVGPTVAGLVVGVMFGTAVVASLPVGALLDRTDARKAVPVAVLTLVIAGVWGWDAGSQGAYPSLIASRALGGLAYVVVWNAGIDVVGRAVPRDQRATAIGIFTASGPVGFALGQGGGPLLAARFGWPSIFLVFTGLAALGFLVFWPASRGVAPRQTRSPTLAEFGAVLRSRNVWIVGLLGFLGYAVYIFVNSWGPSYLTSELAYSLAVSGLLVALFPAVGIISRVSSGLISDRLFGGRRRPVVLGSFIIVAPLLLAFTALRTLSLLVAFLLITGFALQLTLGLSFTYVREVVDPRVAATAVAFQTSVGLAGAFLAPIAGGVVIDMAGYRTAFLLAGLLAVGGIVLAWWAPEPG